MADILIIDNSRKVWEMLSYGLRIREGHQTIQAQGGQTGFQLAVKENPALILLDDGIDGMEELALCQQLRNAGYAAPIIVFLSLANRAAANFLEKYGCTRIMKPFEIREVLGRVHTTLRAPAPIDPLFVVRRDRQEFFQGRIVIDHNQRTILKDGQPMELSQRDYELISYLSGSPGCTFSREQLLHNVWCYKDYLGDMRAVDVAIQRIRSKLEDDPGKPQIIQTKRGVGYYWGL